MSGGPLRSAGGHLYLVSDEKVLAAYAMHPQNASAGARTAGLSRKAYRDRIDRMARDRMLPTFTIQDAPPEVEEPLETLIQRRLDDSARVRDRVSHGELHTIRLHDEGPVGILHIGDPHVDDAGCDFARLWDDLQLVLDTPGMYAGIIGDLHNNWVGRLARLYAMQDVSARNAWRLVEAVLQKIGPRLVYLVAGNHDLWSGAGDPLQWIMRHQPGVLQPHGLRIRFTFPDGADVRANLRHEWPGSSQYNPAFGQGKAAYRGLADHIILGGHKHSSGYFTFFNEHTGILSHCIQVGSYKVRDDYADAGGFARNNTSPSVLTIIDPAAADETERVLVFPSAAQGARVLTALRAPAKTAKTTQSGRRP